MKLLKFALFLALAPLACADAAPMTAEDVKATWLKDLWYQQAAADLKPKAERQKEMERIAGLRASIQSGAADLEAKKAAILVNAQAVRKKAEEEAAKAAEFPVMSDDTGVDLGQLRSAADWATTFGPGNINSAQRKRYAAAVEEYNKAVAEANIQKARALAIQYEQISGKSIVLAENDPKKLAAQIKGMEETLAVAQQKREINEAIEYGNQRTINTLQWQQQQLLDALNSIPLHR